MNLRTKKIGLTGGIGSGKTYVSDILRKMNIPVFYSDKEAGICMQNDLYLISSIKKIFGNNIYSNKILDKKKLAKIIFKNNKLLSKLNNLVHPIVRKRFDNWYANQHTKLIVKETAILFESNSHLKLDFVICVSALEKIRIDRVIKRDKCSLNDVKLRMNQQMKQSKKEQLSDFIIFNNQTDLLIPQILKILEKIG